MHQHTRTLVFLIASILSYVLFVWVCDPSMCVKVKSGFILGAAMQFPGTVVPRA